jgi:hypothetical protein
VDWDLYVRSKSLVPGDIIFLETGNKVGFNLNVGLLLDAPD